MSFLPSLLRRTLAALVCAGIFTGSSLAQEATAPIGLPPGANPDDTVGRLAFSDTALDSVLQTLETLTGRIVIRPQALPSPQLTLNARQPLTRAEAILAIESLLSINGIGVVPFGDKFIKVVPIASIRTEAPELVVGTLRDEAPSGKVVSKLFRLQYLDSASFQTQVAPFLSGFGTVVPFQNSNAVIVTDTVANLQRLEYVVSEVDKRVNIETKFYQIRYATASELADQIRTMIESARGGSGSQGGGGRIVMGSGAAAVQPANVPGVAPAPTGGAVPMQVVFSSNTSINADDRTNQLIVITDPANLPFFDDILDKLDVPADPPTAIEVIPMKHADATELASLLSQFISGQSQSSSQRARTTGGRERGTPFPTLAEQQRQEQQRQLGQPSQPTTLQGAVQTALGDQVTQFSELMTVVADERSNAIIVSGTNSDLALIKSVIDELDIVLPQVRLEVVIAEVTLSKGYQRGIDAIEGKYTEVSGERSNVKGAYGPIGFDVSGVFASGSLTDLTIEAVIAAGRTNSDVNLLSVPTIMTTHNKEATIIVGEARPIVTATQQSVTNTGGSYSTFQFQDIALELVVKPTIGPNDVVQLEIDQKVDALVDTTIINNEEQPIIGRRQATSYVSAKSNQLIVLGGLQKNDVTKTINKAFILGEIPLLGNLFTRKTNTTVKTELIVFIKPTVIRDTSAADADARKVIRELHPSAENAEQINKVGGENFNFPSTKPDNGSKR